MRQINLTVAASTVAVGLTVSSPSVAILAEPACKIITAAGRRYTGPTEITPTDAEQIIEIAGLMPADNITVHAIPTNYGRITWDGATLTVS